MPRIILPKPHSAQAQVLREARKYNIVCCGRRWGKTALGIHLATHRVLDGQPVGWFAPKFSILSAAWRNMTKLLRPIIARTSWVDKRIEFITGGEVEFFSLDSMEDAGIGREFALVIVDEAATVPDLKLAIERNIMPTLADHDGDLWLLSTPRGHNHFYKLWMDGQEPDEPECASWQMPSLSRPNLRSSVVERQRQKMSALIFAQEYEAKFVADQGDVFQGVDDCIGDHEPRIEREPGRSYVIGVDIAKVEDYTVITVLDDTGKQCYLSRFNGRSFERITGEIEEVARAFGAYVLVEQNYGAQCIDDLAKSGIRVEAFATTASSKWKIIDSLAAAIERREIKLLPDPVQTAELKSFGYQIKGKTITTGAPAGTHDDTVIALALAWNAIKNRPHAWFIN